MKTFQVFFLFLALMITGSIQAQLITADPPFPTDNQQVVITFNAAEGSGGLAGYTGDVYAHTGVITNNSSSGSDWKYVVANWGVNIPKAKLTRIAPDLYTLTIGPSVRDYYGVPASETILKMAFVFRSGTQVGGAWLEGKTSQNGDIFYDVAAGGLDVSIISPEQKQILAELNDNIQVTVASLDADSTVLSINNIKVASTTTSSLSYTFSASEYGSYKFMAKAYGTESMVADSFACFVRTPVIVAEKPAGTIDGINYINDTKIILSLFAPYKEHVFVIGDFNNWALDGSNYMKRTPDGQRYWLEISGLEPGKEYVYQYLVDGALRITDPYAHKILDPWNDGYISNTTYPGLIPYPTGKTTGIAGVFQTAREPYNWEVTNFTPPNPADLVIYELHIRDFVATRDIKTVIDTLDYLEKLGVNAIELMPINEFEGNDSWGYNPSFYFATDKAYGRTNDYKRFIDECHKRGIAVIIDMVLNHSYGQSPLLQLYFDPTAGEYGQPTAQNPWYNQTCPHPPYCWGYDFDHQSIHTQQFVDRVNAFWLEEFKVDGFRFDFTKGFTNVQSGWEGSQYDAARIAILKRMADKIWDVNDKTYVILEHFAENSEEIELSNYGMMLWGNMNHSYNEATMGWNANSNFSGISYKQRGWAKPHLVGYMESHDEERLMFKNITYGNSSNQWHDVKKLDIGLKRNAMAAAFFLLVPGPKMIWQFGELGYDVSIDEPCRVCPKPIRWNYYDQFDRRQLYHYYSTLIALRKSHEVFRTDNIAMTTAGAMKRISLIHPDMSVIILGNFGVTAADINPQFTATGAWYDYYNNSTLNVANTTDPINLQPGEFRIYTTLKLDWPSFVGIAEPLEDVNTNSRLWPNPTTGTIYVDLDVQSADNYSINLLNISGQKVTQLLEKRFEKGLHNLSFNPGLSPGIYLVEIKSGNSRELLKFVR